MLKIDGDALSISEDGNGLVCSFGSKFFGWDCLFQCMRSDDDGSCRDETGVLLFVLMLQCL